MKKIYIFAPNTRTFAYHPAITSSSRRTADWKAHCKQWYSLRLSLCSFALFEKANGPVYRPARCELQYYPFRCAFLQLDQALLPACWRVMLCALIYGRSLRGEAAPVCTSCGDPPAVLHALIKCIFHVQRHIFHVHGKPRVAHWECRHNMPEVQTFGNSTAVLIWINECFVPF
jgi:hypothetical protein